MKLEIKPHPHHPYIIGWIKKGSCIQVTNLCHVLVSIGKFYQDSVTCDIVDMDACHILFGHPWQHDVDAANRGKRNIYMFTWEGKKIAMKPIQTSQYNLLLGSSPRRRDQPPDNVNTMATTRSRARVTLRSRGYRDVTATYICRSEIPSRIYAKHQYR